jgi:hypothetical protein
MDIKPCRVKHDETHRDTYREFKRNLDNKRVRRESITDAMDRSFSTHNARSATTLDERRCISSASGTGGREQKRLKKGKDDDPTAMLLNFSPPPRDNSIVSEINTKDSKDSKNFYQLKIHDGPNPSCESKLTMAIADMIHSLGLPFSLSSESKFRKVLFLSRAVGSAYSVPSQKQIANELLDLNFQQYQKKHTEILV